MARLLYLSSCLSAILALTPLAVLALPVADPSVGTSVAPQPPTLTEPNLVQINGGTTSGQNLFHSFESFDIDLGESVYFFSPDAINHIFSRVTGNSRSNIDGTLGTVGSDADLFLINPNGVVFGTDASLDVQGSFLVTTADAVEFGPSGIFSASDPSGDQLLSIDPSAFLFTGSTSPESIINRSSSGGLFSPNIGLQVPDGESLWLLGGDVIVDGGELNASGGLVEIVAVEGIGAVGFSSNILTLPESLERADITITNNSLIDVVAAGKGDILFYGDNIEISNSSSIFTGTFSLAGTIDEPVGDIQIDATGWFNLINRAAVRSILFGNARGGNISISAQEINLVDGSSISTDGIGATGGNVTLKTSGTLSLSGRLSGINGFNNIRASSSSLPFITGPGKSGDILIEANHIELSDGSLIANSIALGSGEGGNLQITTDSLSVTEGAQINSLISPLGRGNLGNLVINASGDIVIDGTDPVQPVIRSVIGNSVGLEAQGNAGDLIITAESLTVSNGAALDSSTFGIGNAGNIIIDVQNHTLFAGTDSGLINTTVLSSVTPAGQGQAGDVQLTTGTLSVTDGAVLASATFSQGDAGNVIINVEEEAVFDGVGMLSRSEASSEVGLGAQGNAGDVRISTGELTVSNGATLESSTAGSGDAGDVIIEAQGHVIFDGSDPSGRFSSRATSQVSTNMARGNGGDIKIFANTLDITNGAELLASTAGMGDAGDVIIVLTDEATLNNGSIFVASESDSQAGNIDISASNIQLENNSILSAESATVNGGNIFLDSDNLLLLRNNSLITATAGTAQGAGNGGNIDISAPYIIAISTENSDIIANAFEGDGGQVNITAQGVFGIEPRPQLTPLSDITASSEQGVSGIIVLNSPDNSFIENSLSELPDVLTNPDTLVANSCVARGQQAGGTFTTTGSGGLPVSPADSQIATYATGNIQPLVDESNQVNNTAPWQSGTAITEPSGIYYTADGRLIMGRDCF